MNKILAATKPLCAALAVGLFSSLPGALAQTPPPEQKIEDLEKQLQALQQAVQDLRKPAAPTNEPTAGGRRGRRGGRGADAEAASSDAATNAVTRSAGTNDPIARIREEGLNHSQVM